MTEKVTMPYFRPTAPAAEGAVFPSVNLQGRLAGAEGKPLTGRFPAVFSIYAVGSEGRPLYQESRNLVVEDGLFSVILGVSQPLSPDVFSGRERHLGIKIGDDPEMLPRQPITSVPYAFVAENAATAGIAGDLDCTGCVGNPDLAANAVVTSKIRDDAVTGRKLAADSVSSSTIADGGVGASSDVSFNYAASDTKGGKANDSGTLDGLDSSEFVLAGEGGGSSASLRAALAPFAVSVVDSDGDVGKFASIAIGMDGFPIISHYDDTTGDLKAAHCEDVACTSATVSTLDSNSDRGRYSSIAIGVDGVPVISYEDSGASDLRFARCVDVACSSATRSVVDSTGFAGRFTSIAIAADGAPIISYYDLVNKDLKVAHCEGPLTCVAATITTIDSAGEVDQYSSIAIRDSGIPSVSYYDTTNLALKWALCADTGCTVLDKIRTVAAAGTPGRWSSLTYTRGGIGPYIVFKDGNFLKLVTCGVDCGAGAGASARLDFSLGDEYCASIALDAGGFPIMSYYHSGSDDLRVVRCLTFTCLSGSETIFTVSIVDRTGDVGKYSSIAIGSDGLPVIAYYDATNQDLKVAHCSRTGCSVP